MTPEPWKAADEQASILLHYCSSDALLWRASCCYSLPPGATPGPLTRVYRLRAGDLLPSTSKNLPGMPLNSNLQQRGGSQNFGNVTAGSLPKAHQVSGARLLCSQRCYAEQHPC